MPNQRLWDMMKGVTNKPIVVGGLFPDHLLPVGRGHRTTGDAGAQCDGNGVIQPAHLADDADAAKSESW